MVRVDLDEDENGMDGCGRWLQSGEKIDLGGECGDSGCKVDCERSDATSKVSHPKTTKGKKKPPQPPSRPGLGLSLYCTTVLYVSLALRYPLPLDQS